MYSRVTLLGGASISSAVKPQSWTGAAERGHVKGGVLGLRKS